MQPNTQNAAFENLFFSQPLFQTFNRTVKVTDWMRAWTAMPANIEFSPRKQQGNN